MALVQAFSIPGVRCWFYSNDHEPPHFHAKKDGEWEIRVRFMEDAESMIEPVWVEAAVAKKVRRRLIALATEHRKALLQEWEQIHDQDGA